MNSLDQKKKWPLVSIVTINWNQLEITCDMLDSLASVTYPNVEIIVVDNGSTEASPGLIKERHPEVELIVSRVNLGFAGGNNLAFPYAKGKYILLLNNDTIVDPHFLEPMIELLEEDREVGVVSPKIFFHGQKEVLQYAGTTGIHPITARGKKFGYKERDLGQHDELRTTGFANGACMLFRADLLHEVGILQEDYFMYYEEHDWCERVKQRGYQIYFQPKSKVYHRVSASTGSNSPMKTYYLNRNRLLFHRRFHHGVVLYLSMLYYLMVPFTRQVVTNLTTRKFAHLKALFSSLWWHIKNERVGQRAFSTFKSHFLL